MPLSVPEVYGGERQNEDDARRLQVENRCLERGWRCGDWKGLESQKYESCDDRTWLKSLDFSSSTPNLPLSFVFDCSNTPNLKLTTTSANRDPENPSLASKGTREHAQSIFKKRAPKTNTETKHTSRRPISEFFTGPSYMFYDNRFVSAEPSCQRLDYQDNREMRSSSYRPDDVSTSLRSIWEEAMTLPQRTLSVKQPSGVLPRRSYRQHQKTHSSFSFSMPRRHATDATKYQQHTRSTSTMSRSITMEHLPRHAPPPTPPSLNPMPCQVRDKTGQFHVVPDTMAYLEIQAQPHAQFLPRLDSRNSPLLADDKSSAETIHSRSERFSLRLRKWLSLRGRAPMRE